METVAAARASTTTVSPNARTSSLQQTGIDVKVRSPVTCMRRGTELIPEGGAVVKQEAEQLCDITVRIQPHAASGADGQQSSTAPVSAPCGDMEETPTIKAITTTTVIRKTAEQNP